MNIDLEDVGKIVTKERILKYIDDIDIYNFYLGGHIKLNTPTSSPFRKDKNPSFGFFINTIGDICFNDFLLGGGDCIRFVEIMFNISHVQALAKIAIDFGLNGFLITTKMEKTYKSYNPIIFQDKKELIKDSKKFKLGKKKRDWKLHDLSYWHQHGIDIETLEKYNVEPISYVFINGNPIYADKYAYCFIERKDNEETYKIYQPFNKEYKWLNNHNSSVWQGWTQLPNKGKTLIITKSLKDVMSIYNTTGISSISLQAESYKPKSHIIDQLKNRFQTLYILYDNDFDKEENWGRIFGEKIADEYEMIQIEIPDKYKSKDYSDMIKNHGVNTAKNLLNNLLLPF